LLRPQGKILFCFRSCYYLSWIHSCSPESSQSRLFWHTMAVILILTP